MILGPTAVALNLLSIMAFAVLIIVAAISIFIKINPDVLARYSASIRRRILWLLALSPWLVGLVAATLTLLSGSQYMTIPAAYDLFHWHHPQEFIFGSWHGLSMIFAISYTSLLFMKNIKRLLLNNSQIKLLHALADPDQNNFYQLDADAPMAFTAGYYRPKCYMTSALRRQLNDKEYRIIQLHENEHARRLDPLKKWFFQLLMSFFPQGTSRLLNQMMVLAMEQCADSAVYRVTKDKSLIAMTLLKVRRLAVGSGENGPNDHAVCHYGVDSISERISYLLSNDKHKTFPFFQVVLTAVTMSVICVLSANIFHHTIEYTLSH